MKLIASDSKLSEVTVDNGPGIKRGKDGAFTVPDQLGKSMLRSGEWGRVGISLRNASGYVCEECGFVSVFRDKCGKCGSTDLNPEDAA